MIKKFGDAGFREAFGLPANDVDVLVDLDILPIKSSLGLRNELIFFSVFSDYLLRDRFEEFFSFRKDAEMLLFGGLLGRGIEMF